SSCRGASTPSKSRAMSRESAVMSSRRSTSAGVVRTGESSVGRLVTLRLLAGGGDVGGPACLFGLVGAIGWGRRSIRGRSGPSLRHHRTVGDDGLGIDRKSVVEGRGANRGGERGRVR